MLHDEKLLLGQLKSLLRESCLDYAIKDELLLCFLRVRKFDKDRAFKCLQNYLKLAGAHPDLLTNLRESRLRPQLDKRLQVICNGRDHQGRRIFIFRAGLWNPEETTLDDIFRCNVFCLQRLAAEPDTQINGIVAIVDLENFCLNQARRFTPSYAKKIADILNQSFPLTFRAIHIVNQNWIVTMIMSIIWPFLPSKIQKRIHYHGRCWSSLHEHVTEADLPEDYGGLQEPLDGELFKTFMPAGDENSRNLFDLN